MTRPLKRGLGVVVAALALVTFTAQAGDDKDKYGKEIGKAAVKKLEYMNDLAVMDQGQIALAELALEKSQNPEVRQFAEQLVKDHKQHLSNLQDWAEARGIEVAKVYLSADDTAVGGSGLSDKTKEQLGEDAQKASERIDKKKNKIRGELDELRNKTGADFDKAFISQITDDQEKGLGHLKAGIKEYKGDASFAMLLNQGQPVLQRHLDTAKSIKKNLKG